MATPVLTCVTRTQGNNRALKEGEVSPAGVRLDFVEVPVLVQAFRRMVRRLEFDVCEMAITTYITARAHGKAFTALPIFLVRGLHHGAIRHHARRPVEDPKHLEEQAVGVNRGYTVTTGVWARGVLAEEYGVDLDRIRWVLSGDEHVEEYVPPPNVLAGPKDRSLHDLLASGELTAVVGVETDDPEIVPLIPDAEERALAQVRKSGVFPINHLIVVRDDVLDRHPRLAVDLFEAFTESKRRYLERLRVGALGEPTATDRVYRRVFERTGDDPLPYGIAPNIQTIDRLLRHAVHQHILTAAPPIEDLFAPVTLKLTG